jgi:hypothetical protein
MKAGTNPGYLSHIINNTHTKSIRVPMNMIGLAIIIRKNNQKLYKGFKIYERSL